MNDITNITGDKDITSLGTISLNKQHNDINATNIHTGEETGINFGFAPNKSQISKLQQEANQAKETAITEIMAGVPTTTQPPLTISRPSVETSPVTEGYTIRDQVMSRLNLLDPETNEYTDTYTNYIQKGGSPVPGYEYAHQELLAQERYDQIFEQVQDNKLSYDSALLEAYGRDILAQSFGIDVTSTAYWKNKYFSDDFSDPFDNRYLMSMVLEQADQYHQKRLQSEYAQSSVKDTQLATLAGQEVDSLSAKKIKDLFPSLKNVDTEDDELFWKAIHTGNISASMRLTQDKDGTYYYLHTDGQVYALDNNNIEKDANGNITSINLNGSNIAYVGRSFITGATNVFKGLADFLATPVSFIWGLCDGEGGVEWNTFANAIDEFAADNLGFAFDTGYVDLDGKTNTGLEWAGLIANFAGTIAGTAAFGGISNGLAHAAQANLASGHNIIAGAENIAGNILKWQTGRLGSQSAATSVGRQWLYKAGAAIVPNMKNALTTTRNNMIKMSIYDDHASNAELAVRTAGTFLINSAIDTLISGGLDDNQRQLYAKTFNKQASADFLGLSKEEVATKLKLANMLTHETNNVLSEELENQASQAVKDLFHARRMTIAFNSMMDFTGNMLTGAIGNVGEINAEGKFDDAAEAFAHGFTFDATVKSALNTVWYSTRSQIKDWNVGLETLNQSHEDFIAHINDQLVKNKSDIQKIDAITSLKKGYLEAINKSEAETFEGKILDGFSFLATADGKDKLPDSLIDIVNKNSSNKAQQFYKDLYNDSMALYRLQLDRTNKFFDIYSNEPKNLITQLTTPFRKMGAKLLGQEGAAKTYEGYAVKDAQHIQNIATELSFYDNSYAEQLFKITDDVNKNNDVDQNIEFIDWDKLKEEHPEIVKAYGDSAYFRLPKNEDRKEGYFIDQAAIEIANKLGYVETLDKDAGIFRLTPYNDTLDGLNESAVLKAIYETSKAFVSADVTNEQKATIISHLSNALTKDNIDAYHKSLIISQVFDTMMNTKYGQDGAPLLKTSEAVDIFRSLLQTEDFKVLKTPNEVTGKTISMLAKASEELYKIQQGKTNLVDLTDKEVMTVLERAYKEGTFSKKEWEQLTTYIKDNNESFLTGNRLGNKKKWVEQKILNEEFKDVVPEKRTEVAHLVDLYLNKPGQITDEIKDTETYKLLTKISETWDKVMEGTKTVTLDQDKVYIDLSKLRGKTETALTKQIATTINVSGVKNIGLISDEFNAFDIEKEVSAIRQLKLHNSQLLEYDLTNNNDVDRLIKDMKSINYNINKNRIKEDLAQINGVYNFRGDSIVLDLATPKNPDDIRDAVLRGKLKVGKTELDFNKLNVASKYVDGQIDIEKAILDSIKLENIDPKIQVTLKEAPLLWTMPLAEVDKDGKFIYTTPIVSSMMGLTAADSPRKVAGKISAQLGTQKEHVEVTSVGAKFTIDQQLADYFTIEYMCRTLLKDPKRTNISLDENEYDKLVKAGIVNRKVLNKTESDPNNFWTVVSKGQNGKYQLRLNVDDDPKETLAKMQNYIVSKDFNVYRLFPILFKDSTIKRQQGLVDAYATVTTGGIEELPPGLERETGLSVLNTRLPWDDANNTQLGTFINKLIINNEGLNYNPIKGANYSAVKLDDSYSSFEEWEKAARKSNNPYDIVATRYLDAFNSMVHGEEGKEEYNNENILLFSRASRKLILDAVNNDKPVTPELVNDIKLSLTNGRKTFKADSNYDIAIQGYYAQGAGSTDDSIALSAKSVATAFGDDNIEVKNTDWIDMPTVQKAIDKVISINTDEEDADRVRFYNQNMVVTFEENDATKLLKGLTGDNFNVPVNDVDEYADLLFDNWREAIDSQQTPRIKESVVPVLRLLYGKDYEQDFALKIYKAAKNQFNLAKSMSNEVTPLALKQRVAPSAVTIEDDAVKGLFKAPFRDEDGNPVNEQGELDKNVADFKARLERSVTDELNKDKVTKLLDNASNAINDELYDSLRKDMMNLRNLYTASPWNGESQSLIDRHEAAGITQTVFNTFSALKNTFKGDEQKLMDTAKVFTYLNTGVDYVGDATKYFVLNRDGSLGDDRELLERYASANLNEFLHNIHNMKKELMGKTLVYTEHQDLSNTAAIKMKYKEINNEEDFNKVTQEMFHYFLLSNSHVLTQDAKTDKDKQVLIEQILTKQIPAERIQELVNRIPSESLSRLQAQKNMYSKFLAENDTLDISRGEFNGAWKNNSMLEVLSMEREAINESLNNPLGIQSNRELNAVSQLTLGLGNPEYYSSEKLETLHDYQDSLNKLKVAQPQTSTDELQNKIIDFLTEDDSIYTVDYLVHNRSLSDMRNEIVSDNIKNGIYIGLNNLGKKQYVDSKDFKDLISSLTNNDVTIKTPYNKVIVFDTETFLDKIDGKTKIFNLGFNVLTKTENGWEVSKHNLNVDYDTEGLSLADKKKLRQQMVDKYINSDTLDYKSKQFRTNEGYQQAIKDYINASGDNLKTPSEIKEFLTNLIGNDKVALIGHNSSTSDIPWLISSGILDEKDSLFKNITHFDTMLLSDSSSDLKTKHTRSKDVLAEKFGLDNSASHSAINDADVTLELFKKIGAQQYAFGALKNKLYNNLTNYLEDEKIAYTEQDLNKVLTQVDSLVQEARNKDPDLQSYFNANYVPKADTLTRAIDLLEYNFNKRLNDGLLAVNTAYRDMVYLSDDAMKALSTNQQLFISRLGAAAEEKGINLRRIGEEFNNACKQLGKCDHDTMLKVLNSSIMKDKILNNLGLTEEDLKSATVNAKVFKNIEAKLPELKSEFENYRLKKDSGMLYDYGRQLLQGLNLTGNKALASELATDATAFYSIREGLTPDEAFPESMPLLETKYGKQLTDFMDSIAGKPDAVLRRSLDGIYDLIDSVAVGKVIKDGISDKDVTVDSSMVVISPAQFKALTHTDYDTYVGEHPELLETGLYSSLLIHPADSNNKVLTRRIVVNPRLQGMALQIPETVLEVIGSRDLDGDHLVLFTPDLSLNNSLKLMTDNMFKAHDVQEQMLNYLRQSDNGYGYYKDMFTNYSVAHDSEILDLCYDADKELAEKGNISEKLTKSFENRVVKLINYYKDQDSSFGNWLKENTSTDKDIQSLVNAVKDKIWLKELNTWEIDRGDIIKFIANPAIERSLEDESKLSHSAELRRQFEANQMIRKNYSYAPIDQTTGVTEKETLQLFKNKEIVHPYTDLLTNGIYASDIVGDYFENYSGTGEELKNNLIGFIDKTYGSNTAKKFMADINLISTDIDNKHMIQAFNDYDALLRNLDMYTRSILNDKALLAELTSPEMLQRFDTMKSQMDAINSTVDLRNQIKKNDIHFGTGRFETDAVDASINDQIIKYINNNDILHNQNLFLDNTATGKAFVITHFGTIPEDAKIKYNKTGEIVKTPYQKTKEAYEYEKEKLEKKLTLLETGKSQNPATPNLSYTDPKTGKWEVPQLQRDIQDTITETKLKIQSLEKALGKFKNTAAYYEKTEKNEDYVKNHWRETPPDISEDTIIVNKNSNIKGLTTLRMHSTKLLKDIKEDKWYKAGTVIDEKGTTLPFDAQFIGGKPGQYKFMSINPISNAFKLTTDIGGKGVAKSYTFSDDDIDILINKPNQNKITFPHNKPIETKERSMVIFDENYNPFVVYGFDVDNTSIKVAEDTLFYNKDKARNYDYLHTVSDANSIGSILYSLGLDYKDGKLTTRVEDAKESVANVYNQNQDYGYANATAFINKLRLAAAFNVMSDKEIQDYFHSSRPASEIVNDELHNKMLASKLVTNTAYTLFKKYQSKLPQNDIVKKLGDRNLENIFGSTLNTAASRDADIDKMISKSDSAEKANTDEFGRSIAKRSASAKAHKDLDLINANKGLENTEEVYTTLQQFYDYMFGDKFVFNPKNAAKLMKEHKIAYKTFVGGTANPENGYHGYDTNSTIKDEGYMSFIPHYDRAKTAYTTSAFEPVSYLSQEIDGSEINPRYRADKNNNTLSYIQAALINSMVDPDVTYAGYNNLPKVLMMLEQLEDINPGDSDKVKRQRLVDTNPKFSYLNSYMYVDIKDDGTPVFNLSRPELLQGELKDIEPEAKKSLFNYTHYTVVHKDDDNTIDASKIDAKDIDIRKQTKERDAIYTTIKSGLFNSRTGEINTDTDLSKLGTGIHSAEAPKILQSGERQEFGTSIWGRQGVKADTELGAQIGTALKNAQAASTYVEQDAMKMLTDLETLVTKTMSAEEFERFTNLAAVAHENNPEKQKALISRFKLENINVTSELDRMAKTYPQVAVAYKNYFTSITQLAKNVSERNGIPYETFVGTMMSPYIGKQDKAYSKATAYSLFHDLAFFEKKYDVTNEVNKAYSNHAFSFFNCAKSFIKETSNLEGVGHIKQCLLDNKLLDNTKLVDGVLNIFDTITNKEDASYWIKESAERKELMTVVFDKVFDLTGVKISPRFKQNPGKVYMDGLKEINKNLEAAISSFNSKYSTDLNSYKDFRNVASFTNELNKSAEAQGVADCYYAKILVAQAMIEGSEQLASDVGKHIQNLYDKGLVLVNEYGQEVKLHGVVKPIGAMPFQNIVENCEIAYNSQNERMWNQYVVEKILSGELYTMREDVADHLDKTYYTKSVPRAELEALQKVSKLSAGLQMSLPAKIVNRFLSFTGFDYSMGIMYDPKTIKNISRARKELVAAYQSNGSQMSDELKAYMIREGQPIGLTGKDPITFSEDMDFGKILNSYMNKMTDPLEFQNHLGRYAIYLTALEGFKNGDPNYGPLYYAKDAIDKLKTDEDKAMYVMDYMLGSPGGFPELAKKTSGIMLYATFPMNFARTMGAYGMTLGKLFEEGFTQENSKDWMRCAITPSMGLAGITAVGSVLWSWLCSLLGLDEEESKEYVYSLSSPDLIGTWVSGKPQKSSSSMNPVENIYSMTIEPFTNTNNKTLIDKLVGLVNTNITSHLNPALKTPIEVMSGYDNIGSSLITTKNSYSRIENATRKALSFVVGSGVANNVVDQYKLDKYSDDRNFGDTLKLGLMRGISYDFGNNKTYKKDTTNYYNEITKLKNFQYKINGGTYSSDVEDYIDARSMTNIRNYRSLYGSYNSDDYARVNRLIKKAIEKHEPASTVYSIIISEYNNGVDEQTLRSVLNNNSLARRLDRLGNKQYEFLDSLSTSEYAKLVSALRFEEFMYPLLKELFPNNKSSSGYTRKYPTYKTSYSSSGSSSSRPYYPKAPTGSYVNYYPNSSNKKVQYNNARSSINKVDVQVSPQMGVWKNDYNETQSFSTYNNNKRKGPVNLLDKPISYLDNPYYNNLSNYEKRKKSGK